MPDQHEQSAQQTTRPSWSVQDGIAALRKARESAAGTTSGAPQADAAPEGTTSGDGESNAGGVEGEDIAVAAGDASDGDLGDTKDPETLYRVTDDETGEEVEVTLTELLRGFKREANFTRKTQALAEDRRKVEQRQKELDEAKALADAERERASEERKRYAETLTALDKVLNAADEEWAKIDWASLKQSDPVEYAVKKADYLDHVEKKRSVDVERKRIAEEQAEERRRQAIEAKSRFAKDIADTFPEWRDDKVKAQDWAAMYKAAQKLGFTDQEIAATTDARIFRMLYLASRHDRAEQARTSAATPAKPNGQAATPARVVNPAGARPAVRTARATEVSSAKAAVRRTGSISDAVRLMQLRRGAPPA